MEYIVYNIRHNIKNFTPKYILSKQEDIVKNISDEINVEISKAPNGSLIFITGLPFILANVSEFLSKNLYFKYWIACEFKPIENNGDFPLTHYGVLFLQKKETKQDIPFNLNTKKYRVAHTTCPACGNLTKDWGGKKHTMNPNGTAYSDVWEINDDLLKTSNNYNQKIVDIIHNLIGLENKMNLINSKIVYDDTSIPDDNTIIEYKDINEFEYDNQILNENCIEFIEKVNEKYPNGVFQIAFSDPPYNLNKNYSKYEDNLRDIEYLEWCEKWLYSKYISLKPGGSLLVMNIPKWSIHHFNFLKKFMLFDKWIVWDALSTPAGKLMPAHYTILHFVKPGSEKMINIDNKLIPNKTYCLRNTCIKNRGSVLSESITDIWRDCHRVKHNKNKNDHPCQLPIKLLDRIITKYSSENDRVFDPFGGTGSAAVSSKITNRNFTITDIDEKYCDIANKNVQKVKENIFGVREYIIEPLNKLKKKKSNYNIKGVEETYMLMCKKNNGILEIDEVNEISPDLYTLLVLYPKSFKKLQSLTKRLNNF